MMRKLAFIVFVAIVCVLSGCCGDGSARIKGDFSGMKQKDIIVEEIVPGRILFLDSVKTNAGGKFSYKYKFRDSNPVFIRLRNEDDHLILLISPGEHVMVNTIINLARNYSVTGSVGSELVRELNVQALDTYYKMEELYRSYFATTLEDQKRDYELQIYNLQVQMKRKSIELLVKNSKSLASIMALYQTLPSGMEIFREENDYRYFAMVADSLAVAYPTSPHVKSLIRNVENRTNAIEKMGSIQVNRSLPNIDLPDIYGVTHHLESLINNKTILLTFWSALDPNSGMVNKELKDLYKKMENRDFEIYQVSLDEDKNVWVSAVIDQNIPWVSVRDEAGGSRSIAARTYQIKSLPENYLISRDGSIVGKNLWGTNLMKKVEEITQ